MKGYGLGLFFLLLPVMAISAKLTPQEQHNDDLIKAPQECMLRGSFLQTALANYQGDVPIERAKQLAAEAAKDNRLYADKAILWANSVIDSIYSDPESKYADVNFNFNEFVTYCGKHYEKYGREKAISINASTLKSDASYSGQCDVTDYTFGKDKTPVVTSTKSKAASVSMVSGNIAIGYDGQIYQVIGNAKKKNDETIWKQNGITYIAQSDNIFHVIKKESGDRKSVV